MLLWRQAYVAIKLYSTIQYAFVWHLKNKYFLTIHARFAI